MSSNTELSLLLMKEELIRNRHERDALTAKIHGNELELDPVFHTKTLDNPEEYMRGILRPLDETVEIKEKMLFLLMPSWHLTRDQFMIVPRGVHGSLPWVTDTRYIFEKGFYLLSDDVPNLDSGNFIYTAQDILYKKYGLFFTDCNREPDIPQAFIRPYNLREVVR